MNPRTVPEQTEASHVCNGQTAAPSHCNTIFQLSTILHQPLDMKIYIASTLAFHIATAAAAAEPAQHNVVSDNHNVSCTSRLLA